MNTSQTEGLFRAVTGADVAMTRSKRTFDLLNMTPESGDRFPF
jgi:hypothetical protein